MSAIRVQPHLIGSLLPATVFDGPSGFVAHNPVAGLAGIPTPGVYLPAGEPMTPRVGSISRACFVILLLLSGAAAPGRAQNITGPGPLNFGPVNVGSSVTLALTYTVGATTTFGASVAVTEGAANLDFTVSGGGTCTGTLPPGATCFLNVTFAPLTPGSHKGQVSVSGVATLIYGIGQGPAVAFGSGVQTTVASGLPIGPLAAAVDGLGSVYIVQSGFDEVLQVPAGGGPPITLLDVHSLLNPGRLAVDGAGNLLVANTGGNNLLSFPPSCQTLVCAKTLLSSLSAPPIAVAVDGAGNVFVALETGGASNNVYKFVPAACPSASSTCLVPVAPGKQFNASDVAADGAGNLFIADNVLGVVEVPAGCTSAQCVTTVGGGLFGNAVAVDGAGNVFVAQSGSNRVILAPAGCSSAACQTTVGNGLSNPSGVAVDDAGNVYIADFGNTRVVKVQLAQPPSLSFSTTNVGATSIDSPQSVTIRNIGNQTLNAIAPGLTVTGPNFLQVAGTGTPADCSSGFALAPGAGCNLSISFQPQSAGPLTSTAVFTDNALNAPSASQSIALAGAGTALLPQTITFTTNAPANAAYPGNFTVAATGGGSGNPVTFSSSGACSNVGATYTMTGSKGTCSVIANQAGNANYGAAPQVTQTVNATTPVSQSITFTLSPPSSAAYLTTFAVAATGGASGNPVTFSSSGACTNSGATYTMTSGAGMCSVIANQAGNVNYPAAAQITLTVTATLASQTITFPTIPTQAGPGTVTLAATASSGLTVSYTVTSGPATVSGIILTTTGAGSVAVQARQAGSTNYSAAAPVSQTFTVNANAGGLNGQNCNGEYAGMYNGSLTVSTGQTCTFTNGGVTGNITPTGGTVVLENTSSIGGNLQISGGSLSVSNLTVGGNLAMSGGSLSIGNSTVDGNLQISGGVTFSIGPGVTIKNNLMLSNLSAGAGPDQVCGANIQGNLQLQKSGAAVLIGAVTGCAGNSVSGNLQVQNNTAATQVFNNKVGGNLECSGNNSITGGGNAASKKTDQCAAF